MKLYNNLTKQVEELTDQQVGIYSCGPTVYNHVHVGNMLAFTIADTLRRVLAVEGRKVTHVMNITDIDDKTIQASQNEYPNIKPEKALHEHTRYYEKLFMEDMRQVGNDVDAITFIRATQSIESMQELIKTLYDSGIAYTSGDGIYFSIGAYKKSGKKYGQLVEITAESTGASRVDNDEYDKENIHDFALWKKQKANEPAWAFTLDNQDMTGRPGWHIECSAMSSGALGQPFTIHTGGIDLAFPHHENEIAQSTAADGELLAKWFVHNEHVLVDGKKMSKSLKNFYTLADITKREYDPLAFRLFCLQGHYRKQSNFSWKNLQAASNRLRHLRELAELRWQYLDFLSEDEMELITRTQSDMRKALADDLNTPQALAALSHAVDIFGVSGLSKDSAESFEKLLQFTDEVLGLRLIESTPDIEPHHKELIKQREDARTDKDFASADEARDKLLEDGIRLNDTPHGVLWHRE